MVPVLMRTLYCTSCLSSRVIDPAGSHAFVCPTCNAEIPLSQLCALNDLAEAAVLEYLYTQVSAYDKPARHQLCYKLVPDDMLMKIGVFLISSCASGLAWDKIKRRVRRFFGERKSIHVRAAGSFDPKTKTIVIGVRHIRTIELSNPKKLEIVSSLEGYFRSTSSQSKLKRIIEGKGRRDKKSK